MTLVVVTGWPGGQVLHGGGGVPEPHGEDCRGSTATPVGLVARTRRKEPIARCGAEMDKGEGGASPQRSMTSH